MGSNIKKIPLSDEIELNAKLNGTNSYVREYIITHVDSKDEIVQIVPLVEYIECRFDKCVRKYKNWSEHTFQQKEHLFEKEFSEEDFDYFRKKGWTK